MKFYVYVRSDGNCRLDYAQRDEERGIIGTIHDLPDPIATSETLDCAIDSAYSHLGRSPRDSVYIADGDNRLLRMLSCEQYQKTSSDFGKRIFFAWACFTFAIIAVLIGFLFGSANLGTLFLALSLGLYMIIVRTGTFNEVEAAPVSFVCAALVIMLIPAIQSAWKAYQNSG